MRLDITKLTLRQWKAAVLMFVMFFLVAPYSFGQFTITTEVGTNFTGGNGVTGSSAVTFSIRNNNADAMILTGVDAFWQTANNGTNVVLWYTDVTLGGPTGGISSPNWQTIASAGPIAVPTNGYYETFTGLTFMIPGNTTYRFALQSSNGIRYSGESPVPSPSVFSANGIDLGVYNADFGSGVIGYGGPFPTPPNQPRAFTGRIHLMPATACAGAPIAGTASANPTLACQNGITNLSLSGSSLGTGLTYQWYSSPDNVNFNIIPGATTLNYAATVSLAGNNYFRCVVTCTNSGLSETSASVLVVGSPQLNGVYTINNLLPTGGTNFNNFQDAFLALACGASGPVTMNVEAGQTFTSTGPLVANFSGTSINTITFQKSGVGVNPSISFTGTTATADAGLRFEGASWITWDGIDLLQGGTSSADWIEYAINIRKASATQGSTNNNFRNFSIDLGNNTATTLRGVFMENVVATTSPSGASSNNIFENLTITNTNSAGFWLAGSGTAGNQDVNNQIIDCNITPQSAAAVMYGIYMTGQENFLINNNTLGNYNPSSTSTLNLIYITGASTTTNGLITNNVIENVNNSSTGIVYGIQIFNGGNFEISQNTIRNLSGGGTVRGIFLNGVAATTSNVHRNRIYGINSNSATTTYAAGIQSGPGVNRIYNNMITGITAQTSTATPAVRGIDITGGAIQEIYNNTVVLTGTSSSSAALAWSTTTIQFDIRNNIFLNNSTSSTFAAAAYRSTAGAPNFTASSGNNLYYAGVPSVTNPIYRNATNSVEDLTSYLSLSIESVGYTENLQYTVSNGQVSIDQVAATFVESGAQVIALVSNDYYGTARGPYPLVGQQPNGGTAPDVGAEENDFLINIPLTAPECATLNSPANNLVDQCTSTPLVLNWSPSLTGPLPTNGYDVFFGTTTPPPFVANVSTTSYTVSGLAAGQTYYWSIEPKNAAGNAAGCSIFSLTTANHTITSTTPGSVCGLGTVQLQATASSGDVMWYASPSGGSTLATGNSFTTPVINQTTTYYAAAVLGGGTQNVGYPGILNPTSGSGTTNFGIVFDALSPFTLQQVTIYPVSATSASGVVTVDVIDGSNNILHTATFNVVGSPGGVNPVNLPLNFAIQPGTNLKLRPSSFTGISGLNFQPSAGAPGGNWGYPFSVPGVVNLLYSTLTAAPTNTPRVDLYYYFYDWVISTGCESPRVPVVATVSTADEITITPSATTSCPNELVTLGASSANTNYVYTWMPGNLSGASINVNPLQTTTYSVTGTDGICTDQESVTITVQGAVLGTISGNTNICSGSSTNLVLNGSVGNIQWQFFDGTNWVDIAGQTSSTITLSPTTTTDYRATVGFVGCPTIFTPAVTVVVTTVETPTVQGGSVCGQGSVQLQANASAGVIHWWNTPTGGSPLGTGSSYNTPVINATTTYYASNIDGGSTFNTSVLTPFGSAATVLTTYGQVFTADLPFVLNSVQVHSTTGSAITISLFNSTGTVMLETTGSVAVTPGTSPIIPLGFNIPPGTYRLAINGMTGNFIRDNSGVTYPFALANGIGTMLGFHSSLTGAVTTTSSYYFAYNWNVSTGCESPRIPVEATVTPADAITITPNAITACPSDPVTLTASAANPNYIYTWTPENLTGASVQVSPLVTTTYTVTGTDGICTDVETVTVTVTGAAVGAISNNTSMCFGDNRTLSISGVVGDIQWQSFDGVNWNNIAGANSASTVVSPATTTDYRVQVSFPNCPPIFSAITTVTVSDPTPLNPQGSAICAAGDATFSVSAPMGTTIEWFDAPVDGNLVGSGESITANITETTTLYAQGSSGGGIATAGKPTYQNTVNTSGNNWGLVFDVVTNDVVINSVDVYSVGAGGSMTVELRDNTGALLQTVGTYSYPPGTTANPVLVTFELNLPVAVGTGYRLVSANMSGNLIRETSGNTFPYVGSDGNVNIVSGFITNPGSNTYYWFYNWQISSGCESGLIPVTSTVGAPIQGTTVAEACGSYTWIDGNTYTQSNNTATYTIPGAAANGCDSLITLNLTIFDFVTGTDVVTACGPYIWIDGNIYTQNNNTQTFLIPNGAGSGCDSLVTLNLTIVNFAVTATNNGDLTISASGGESFQWVTCPGFTPIAGATSSVFTATTNGQYAVIATDANGCQSTSNCVTISNVGIESFDANSVLIYPNPTNDKVVIEFNGTEARAELFDAQGKLIQTSQIVSGDQISLINEQSGVYFVRITTNNSSSVHRIVKQ
jgi:hypothetical protein